MANYTHTVLILSDINAQAVSQLKSKCNLIKEHIDERFAIHVSCNFTFKKL